MIANSTNIIQAHFVYV